MGYSPPHRTECRTPALSLPEETRYRILKLLEEYPETSQRQLADALGISLGKANYCLKALIDNGWVKARNFARNSNKRSYAYWLTAKGIQEKARVTKRFLQRKLQEHEALEREIEELRKEAAMLSSSSPAPEFDSSE